LNWKLQNSYHFVQYHFVRSPFRKLWKYKYGSINRQVIFVTLCVHRNDNF